MSEQVLSGKDLLKKVDEFGGLSKKKEIARACGYVTTTKSGKSRVNLMKFMNALLAAKGLAMDPEANGTRGGRTASYKIQVQKNGNLLVGAAYTRDMGLEPGTEFEIVLGRKHIKLVKLNKDGTASED